MIIEELKQTYFENITNSSENFIKHFHDSYAIGITNRGLFKSIKENKAEMSYTRSTRVINPSEVHEGVSKEWSFTTFYPKVELLSQIYEQIFFKRRVPVFQRQIIEDEVLYLKLYIFFDSVFKKDDKMRVEILLLEALSYLIKNYANHSKDKECDDKNINGIKRAKEFIHDRLCENITIDDLSKVSSLSKYHFLRAFKREFGITPHQYIVSKRVNLAKSSIKKGVSLSSLAIESGFYDQSHFIRNFKKVYGYTPSDILTNSNIIQY